MASNLETLGHFILTLGGILLSITAILLVWPKGYLITLLMVGLIAIAWGAVILAWDY
jgi:hypothetical protein